MSDYKLIDIARLTKFKEKLLGILTYSSPTTSTSSTSIEFIDTVSQSNGKISASKKKVSTFEGGNTAGLVPAPGTNASGTFLGSNGQWSKPTGTTYNDYKFSTTTKAGAAGLVPQPGTSAVGKFLKGDSGWSDLPTASTSNSGIVKLDNSTNSTSTTTAATPNAIKAVYTAAVNAASNAGATAGANAASSYATAAKNSADSASTYATNAKNSADSAASAANTAVTNKINGLSYNDPSASTATSTTFISNISQTNGIISATKKTLPTANTTAAGIVKLSNTINNDEDKATTPKAVNDAIKNLGYTDPTDGTATETSTTFISNISQTNGVISATKKKLPTFAGSSQPGIVSAPEGLSENYLLNATGGWTAIDEELDPDSTNPVQNKTLYNLETYHNVFVSLQKVGGVDTAILSIRNGNKPIDLSKVKNFESIKCIATGTWGIIDNGYTNIELKVESGDTYKSIYTGYQEGWVSSLSGMAGFRQTKRTVTSQLLFITEENIIKKINNIAFTIGTTFEIVKMDGDYYIVDDPVLIRYSNPYEKKDENGNIIYEYKRNSIAYASGLKKQWFSNINISKNGQSIYFPIKMTTTDYSITEARKGENLSDTTGYVEKYLDYFVVNPENDHIADFFVIGY